LGAGCCSSLNAGGGKLEVKILPTPTTILSFLYVGEVNRSRFSTHGLLQGKIYPLVGPGFPSRVEGTPIEVKLAEARRGLNEVDVVGVPAAVAAHGPLLNEVLFYQILAGYRDGPDAEAGPRGDGVAVQVAEKPAPVGSRHHTHGLESFEMAFSFRVPAQDLRLQRQHQQDLERTAG
jgi:hypothetical protein